MQPYSEKELVFSLTILPPGRLEAPANLIAWPRLMAPVGIHFQKNAQPSLKVVKAEFAGRRRCVPPWPAQTALGRTRRGGAIGHPRTPAHPRGAWRTRSPVASGEVGAGGTRVRSAPSSGLGQPRGSEAKAGRPAQSRAHSRAGGSPSPAAPS